MTRRFRITTCIVIFLFTCISRSFGQTIINPTIIDTNYLQIPSKGWGIRVYSITKKSPLYLSSSGLDNTISFVPERKIALGLGFATRSFALDMALPIYKNSAISDHHTTGFNLLSSIYRRQHNVDILFQNNQGFAGKSNINGVTKYVERDDLRSFLFALNYIHLFNYQRFSLNPSFVGTQIQKKSAGSPLLGFFISNLSVSSNDTIIPPEFSGEVNDHAQFSSANIFSAGIIGGYAYTFVLPKHFFISLSLTPGITFSRGVTIMDSVREFGNPATVSPKLITKNAVGFAGKRFYTLFLYNLDLNFVSLGNKNLFLYTPEKIKLLFGLRIKT